MAMTQSTPIRRWPKLASAFLRISIGYLLVIWGADKLVNPAHGLAVSDHFYFGLFSMRGLMPVFGVVEILIGFLAIFGSGSARSF
jgi:hypothetical protein